MVLTTAMMAALPTRTRLFLANAAVETRIRTLTLIAPLTVWMAVLTIRTRLHLVLVAVAYLMQTQMVMLSLIAKRYVTQIPINLTLAFAVAIKSM
jgi:hypothetical protein